MPNNNENNRETTSSIDNWVSQYIDLAGNISSPLLNALRD
jgi:hypothetical protein